MNGQDTPKKEQGSVPSEKPTPAYQLTKLELKRRLKHIAGLCYSLVCDISNVEIEAEQLRAENEYLRRKLGKIDTGKKRQLVSPEERVLCAGSVRIMATCLLSPTNSLNVSGSTSEGKKSGVSAFAIL